MNYFEKISRFTFLFGLIMLPSFVLSGASFPYNFGKLVFFGIIISISFLFLVLSKKEINLPSKEILLLFFTFFILSLFSPDQNVSILSTFQRYSEGFIVDFIILISCVLILSLFKNININLILFIGSIPVVLVGLYESLTQSERIISTFGQPNFLSIYLVICIISIFKHFRNQNVVVPFAISAPYLFLIVSSASVTSFIIFLFIFFIFLKIQKSTIPNLLLLFFFLALIFVIFLKGNILWMKLNDVLRQTNISQEHTFISDSLDVRLILWGKTVQLISNPSYILQGHGTNTFVYFFEKDRPVELNETSEKHLIFDKPHNYYLEILFSYGLLGFVVFLYLVYVSLNNQSDYKIEIIIILLFLIFHWLDLTLKVFFFLFITLNLKNTKIKISNNPSLIVFPIVIILNLFARFLYDQKEISIQKQSLHTVSKHTQ